MAHPLVGARRPPRRPAAPAAAARLQPDRPAQPQHRHRAAGRADPVALEGRRLRRLPHVRRQAAHRGHRHEAPPGARSGRSGLPGASAGRRTRPSSRRLATRAAKPTTPASRPSTPPANGSTREELRRTAAQHKAEREARRPVCASCGTRFTDARWKAIEPTGWGTPARPTRTCATTASSAPSPPSVKPNRPGPSTRSTTGPCPSRRPAAPGSPASAADVRTGTTAGQDRPARPQWLPQGFGSACLRALSQSGGLVRELVHQPVGGGAGGAPNGALGYRGGQAGTSGGLLRDGRGVRAAGRARERCPGS